MSSRRRALLAVAACASLTWSLAIAVVAQPARGLASVPLLTLDLLSPLPTLDLLSPLPTLDLLSPLPTLDLLSPLPTVDLGTPLPTVDLGTPLPTVNLGTPLPSVNLGTPLPSVNLGTPLPGSSDDPDNGTPRPGESEPGSGPGGAGTEGSPNAPGGAGPVSIDAVDPPARSLFVTSAEARAAREARGLAEGSSGPGLLEALDWAVPALAVTVPVLLVAGLIALQVLGGAAWIHAARRHLDRVRIRGPVRPEPVDSVEADAVQRGS